MKKNYKLGFSLIEISVVVLIIGVLIAAITTGTDLVKRSKLASARNLSSNSSIYGMKDLVLWFEPSLPTSFYAEGEGEPIEVWSNNSKFYSIGSAVQSSDENPKLPIYIKDAINHIPAVRFYCESASDCGQHLNIPDVAGLLEETDLTIFILENRNSNNTDVKRNILTSGGNNGLEIYYNNSDQFTVDNKSGEPKISNVSPVAPTLHYLSLFYSSNNEDFKVDDNIIIRKGYNYYKNKRLPENGAMPSVTTVIQDNDENSRFSTGSMGETIKIGNDTQSYSGNIAEILIFNRRLRQEELVDIFDYFEAKYNIALED